MRYVPRALAPRAGEAEDSSSEESDEEVTLGPHMSIFDDCVRTGVEVSGGVPTRAVYN